MNNDSSKPFSEMTPDELKAASEHASGQIRANIAAWRESRKAKNWDGTRDAVQQQMAWVSVINQIGDELTRRTKIDRSNIAELKALTDELKAEMGKKGVPLK